MASLKEMRNRIGSVKSTQKITKALQMVAAAKFRRAQESAMAARPYAERMGSVIANLAKSVTGPGAPVLLAGTGKDHKHLLVVAAADSGLAGAISSSVVRAARERVYELQAAGKDVRIICVGRKTVAPLRRLFGDKVVATFDMSKEKVLTLSSAKPIADRILEAFENGEADVVTLFYSRFKNVVSQVPTARQLIPAVVISTDSSGPAPDLKGGVYTYEPEETAILEALLPQNLRVQLLSALLENKAGFYASQMTAMDNATRNAGDLISDLTKQYNRSRQAQITKELIEIISGAEAL